MIKRTDKWSLKDNLFILEYFFRHYKSMSYEAITSNITTEIGTSRASIVMKINNMIYILSNGNRGCSNYSEDSRNAVFLYLKNHPALTVKKMLTILN